jgi:hypothetical protein
MQTPNVIRQRFQRIVTRIQVGQRTQLHMSNHENAMNNIQKEKQRANRHGMGYREGKSRHAAISSQCPTAWVRTNTTWNDSTS